MDYSQLSDEELEQIISGVKPALAAANPAVASAVKGVLDRKAAEPAPVDTSRGSNGLQLGLAGIGSDLSGIGNGLKEKAQLAFAPDGPAGEALRSRIAADRASREATNKDLFNNPEAQAGRFVGAAATAASAPARIGAQMALQAALAGAGPGGSKPTSIGNELLNSALNAGTAAGTEGVLGLGVRALGKTLGAGLGKMTPDGMTALKTKLAAENLGLPPTSLEQLYPGTDLGRIGRNIAGYEERTLAQAKALKDRLDKPLQTPEGSVPDVGRAYVDELSQAAKNRLNLGAEKYKAVDEHVAANGLGNFMPIYTARSITNTNNPGYDVAADMLKRYGFDPASVAGAKASDLGKMPLNFADFHTMRMAANKALGTLNRGMATAERMGAAIPAENRAAKGFLSDFKSALDNDAERWAAKHADNAEAMGLYRDATKYYRDVVAPTVLDNPVARKAMSARSGFRTGREGLAAATSEAGAPLVDRLRPTMTPNGEDLTQVLRALPDVRKAALSQDLSLPESRNGLGQLTRAAAYHPLLALEMASSRLPGLRALSESTPAAKMVGAQDVLSGAQPGPGSVLRALQQGKLRDRLAPAQGVAPRSAWGALQYLQDPLDARTRRLLGVK